MIRALFALLSLATPSHAREPLVVPLAALSRSVWLAERRQVKEWCRSILEISADGKRFGCGLSQISIFDLATASYEEAVLDPDRGYSKRKAYREMKGEWVSAITPDFKKAALRQADAGVMSAWDVIALYEVGTRGRALTIAGFKGVVKALALSRDGGAVAAGFEDRLLVFDGATGHELASLKRPGPVNELRFTPDGRTLAGSSGEAVFLWDWSGREPPHEIQRKASVRAISPDGRYLALSDALYDLRTRELVREFPARLETVGFSADGRTLAGASIASLMILDTGSGRWEEAEAELVIERVAVSPDGSVILASHGVRRDGEDLVYDGISYFARRDPQEVFRSAVAESVEPRAAAAKERAARPIKAELERKLRELGERNKALLAPKDEFETTEAHNARLERARTEEEVLRSEYRKRIEEAGTEAHGREAEAVDRLKRQGFKLKTRATFVSYDADRQEVQLEAWGQRFFVKETPDRAKWLKEKGGLSVQGTFRPRDAQTASVLGAALRDAHDQGSEILRQGPVDAVPAAVAVPPDLRLKAVTLRDSSSDGVVDSEEKAKIVVEAANGGKGSAYGVSLDLVPDGEAPHGLELQRSLYVGTIEPGGRRTLEVELGGGPDLAAGEARLKVSLREANGFDSSTTILTFATRDFKAPKLEAVKLEIADGEGRRVLSRGVEAGVSLSVRNSGGGPARGVWVGLETGSPEVKLFGEARASLGTLAPGETKSASFSLAVTRRYAGPPELPIVWTIGEERDRYHAKPELKLALGQEAPEIAVVAIKARAETAFDEQSDVERAPVLQEGERALGPDDLAVVIGIERYGNLSAKSDYSYADAKLVRAYLKAFGIPERNIEFLSDEKATLSAITTAFERKLGNKVKKGSRVLVYYSGHGAPDPATGEAYLVPHDGDPNYLASSGYPLRRLYETLGKLPSREVLVMLDACFSGAGGRSVVARGTRPLTPVFSIPNIPEGVAVLAATQGSQNSTSSPERGHGVFTYHLLRALKEGKRDVAEIYSYVKPRVEDDAKAINVEQSPALLPDPDRVRGRYLLRR